MQSTFPKVTMIPVSVGAGVHKTLEDVKRVAATYPVETITVGSYTKEKRDGNAGTTDFVDEILGYGNSKGLPNFGLAGLEQHLPSMASTAQASNKKFVVSISCMSPEDTREVAAFIATTYGVDGIELNTACPNIVQGAKRKPLIGLSKSLMTEYLDALVAADLGRIPVRIKVTPYRDDEIEWCADLLRSRSDLNITHVVATNTIPGCQAFRTDGRMVMPEIGKFGGSGAMLHAWSVGNNQTWNECLRGSAIKTIGAGGADSYQRVMNFARAGSSECQVVGAYAYSPHGVRVINNIYTEALGADIIAGTDQL
jgi:dihydroorotate dehydrogenase